MLDQPIFTIHYPIARSIYDTQLYCDFKLSDVERFVWTLIGGLGGEAEETALFLPIMRQVFAPAQQPGRR
jgi:hypothetical protein